MDRGEIRIILLSTIACVVLNRAIVAPAAAPPQRRTADEVLVVYNDQSPVSKSIALDYAHQRRVDHLLAIHTVDSAVSTDNETIPMDVYRQAVEKPVRDYLAWHQRIQFIVLTKGVPLRIVGSDTGQRGDQTSPDTPLTGSLDNHLASMDYKDLPGSVKMSITGSGATGFGWRNRYWKADEPFSHARFGGYLVTRLDGYTEADAKALVARALAAERHLTDGKILLDVQPGFGMGDGADQPEEIRGTTILQEYDWSNYNADMRQAHDMLVNRHIPDELDMNPQFVGGRSGLIGYFSFGSNDSQFKAEAYQSLSFAPGSISDTAVSTSARTFLPTQGGQSLLVDLIKHGLTCGQGYSDEPLLQGVSSPRIDLERYTAGFTMAESFYMASRFTGWQNIVVGDPLCCPYGRWER